MPDDTEHSNYDAFLAELKGELERDDFSTVSAYPLEVKRWCVQMTDTAGSAWMEIDCEDETAIRSGEVDFQFTVAVGPVNARKLIDFLRALPPEPDDEERPNA